MELVLLAFTILVLAIVELLKVVHLRMDVDIYFEIFFSR